MQGSINEKIKERKDNMHEAHNKSLEVKIEALEWVQAQILDLVNAKKQRSG